MIVKRPPMGWNSWNTFAANINEQLIKDTADVMAESGLLEAGYDYLVIDDCWSLRERGADGKIVPDPEKFPNGMKAVADYVHSKGLKFGMYSCNGNLTCAGFPGSFEHEFVDAETFAEWGVDYLKYDNCFRPIHQPGELLYRRMGLALANCGRDICFSACNWGIDNSPDWIKTTGAHLWRSTGDIFDKWESVKELSMHQLELLTRNGQGCFNDMDMLVVGMHGNGHVGMGGMTFEEYKTHFSIWCFLGSPLMIGCDIRNMDDETKQILFNKEIIAIDQDAAYRQPFTIGDSWGNREVWVMGRHLENGDIAIGMFNLCDSDAWPIFSLDALGLNRSTGMTLKMTDVWSGEEVKVSNEMFRLDCLPAHTCRVFRAKVVKA